MPAAHGPAPDQDDRVPSGARLVFVSYCREDAEWLRRFAVMLKPEVRERGVEVWTDTQIGPSREWRPEIDAALARADVALLLVSPDFLASDFVMDQELPVLLERGVPLVPVLLRSCRYKTVRALASAQWGHDPERDGPVAMADDVHGAIVRVTDALMTVLDGRAVTGGADDVLPPPISRIEDGWGERETVPGVAVPGVVAVGDRPGRSTLFHRRRLDLSSVTTRGSTNAASARW